MFKIRYPEQEKGNRRKLKLFLGSHSFTNIKFSHFTSINVICILNNLPGWTFLITDKDKNTWGERCPVDLNVLFRQNRESEVTSLLIILSHAHAVEHTHALWRFYSKDFVSVNDAGFSAHPTCFWSTWPLVWPFEDNLQQQQSLCASLHIIFPHYFFNVTFAVAWIQQRGSGVRKRRVKMQVSFGSTVVFGHTSLRDFTETKPFELLALQLSIKHWPSTLTLCIDP